MTLKREDSIAASLAPQNDVLRYVPSGLYTFGCCHYGHKAPYRTAEVAADSLDNAWRKARLEIQIGSTEHLCHVETKPNPAFMQEQARWVRQRDLRRDPDNEIQVELKVQRERSL